ncbi:c-type cytochrome [Arcobacter sp. FWKO B]|uniref:c-type cytochrome n=1 Tax=Arcobacter sp. FWKO B TaxID=2593672 RepID=UPI0018A5FB6F|nr:c-type cytochrome [Arcobacter sp. FWKO B]QOG11708.1 cytochrome c1 [Arcobacter sp. FWKO B]
MRELKIFGVVVAFTLITYWGVEPLAHSVFHPPVAPADYTYSDVDGLNGKSGDATNGAELVQSNCTACHSIESQGFPMLMDNASAAASYGVVPPDLSTAGKIYDANFLAAFIKDPVKASKLEHVFDDSKAHPMPGYAWMDEQDIADMVAYLQSIAPSDMTNKEVFTDACLRCHGIKYGDFYGGSMNAQTPKAEIMAYMGKLPPDLSQYIVSRGESYLHTFINDPQKHLEGTAMPRVGLTQEAEAQVITYMSEVGQSKKAERESLGVKVLAYLVIFAIFAWLWKAKIWREVH